jgi:hypothetical protein
VGGTQNVSFLGRRYFKLPILSCPRIPPATQATTGFTGRFSFFLMRKCIAFDFILLLISKNVLFTFSHSLFFQNVSCLIHIGCLFTEMKCTKQSVIGVHPCSFTGNEIYKTKCHQVHFSVFIHRK